MPYTPADLFSELPGMFGFYPTESICIIGLEENATQLESVSTCYRIDIDKVDNIGDIPNSRYHCLALIVSHGSPREIETIAKKICNNIPHSVDVWHVADVIEDEKIRFLRSNNTDITNLSEKYTTGVIKPIYTTRSARCLLAKGNTILINRKEAEAHFAWRNSDTTDKSSHDEAFTFYAELYYAAQERDSGNNAELKLLHQEYVDLIRSFLRVNERDNNHNPDINTDIMGLALFMLDTTHGTSELRDLLLGEALDYPNAGCALLHKAAQYAYTQNQRSNALISYAVANNTTTGAFALGLAFDEDSDHPLTRLVHMTSIHTDISFVRNKLAEAVVFIRSRNHISNPSF